MVKKLGVTSKLNTVEEIKPPITAAAMGARKLLSAPPKPITKGNIPATMAIVVMTMGRARLWQASISASKRLKPCSRCAMMAYSTSKMEFLVDTPISITKPIKDGIESILSAISRPKKAPPNDRMTDGKIVMGCMKSLNKSTSTM